MRGYPKHIGNKRDFLNLLAMPEHKETALKDLKKVKDLKDDTVVRVISGSEEDGNLVTEVIANPNPKWKQLGFKDKKDVDDLVTVQEVI